LRFEYKEVASEIFRDSHLTEVILFPVPSPGGFAALLLDGGRNAEEDSAGRGDFPDKPICVHRRSSAVFIFSAL